MRPRLAKLLDRVFPDQLAISGISEFRPYMIEFTTPQFRISLWLAVFTFAIFGIWDVFGEGGGVLTTRFRFLVICPITAAFASSGNSQLARTYRETFLLVFASVATILACFLIVLIDKEFPFKIVSGNATLNFYLIIFFAYALLPVLVVDGIFLGAIAITAHAILLCFYSDVGLVVNSFYAFHTMVAVTVGMFVAYWRERFIRSDFVSKREIVRIRAASEAMSTKLLISYRRSDSDAIAGRIRDRLAHHFGESSIFMDIDSIDIGRDFRTEIMAALNETDALIAIIGRKWLGGSQERIMEAKDPVRLEVETALARGIPVIPTLVDGATMPAASELPATLRELSFRNAAEIDAGRDFNQHIERLIRAIERAIRDRKTHAPPDPASMRGNVNT